MKYQYNYSIITAILFTSGILIMCSLYTAIPLTSTFSNEFDISPSLAAMNGVVFSITYSISCLFYGIISEKYGRIRVILLSLVGLVVICFSIGFVNSFYSLLILRGFQGIFTAAFSPIAITYATETYPSSKRLTALSFISMGFMLSGIIGQISTELFIRQFDWHIIYFVLTVFYILLFVLIFKKIPESPNRNPDVKILKFFTSFKDIGANKRVLICYFISLTLLIMFISMYMVLNHYIVSPEINGNAKTAFFVKFFGVIGMMSSVFSGRLSGRFGVKRVLSTALTICLLSIILMGLITNILIITILSIFFVAGITFAIPLIISKINMIVQDNRGFFLSVNTFILFLGTAIAPILSVYLFSLQHNFSMFSLIASIALLATIASILLPDDEAII
ncbi:MFS transporter [Staphylococcus casei]|uniref:MFS transporter n=1 Tax=Staphylococcus casei TaxID=201828 RepID=A0ABZ2WEU0_9STAP